MNRFGREVCGRDEGCLAPEPVLPPYQAAALMIFTNTCADGFARSEMTGTIQHFKMEVAREEATGAGFVWDANLQDEVRRCARWFTAEARRKEKEKADKAERVRKARERLRVN